MTRVCIHLGNHIHPVAFGICRESLDTIFGLIVVEVSKTRIATNSAIAFAASKQFLDTLFIYNIDRPKRDVIGEVVSGCYK